MLRHPRNSVRFEVADTGIGIPATTCRAFLNGSTASTRREPGARWHRLGTLDCQASDPIHRRSDRRDQPGRLRFQVYRLSAQAFCRRPSISTGRWSPLRENVGVSRCRVRMGGRVVNPPVNECQRVAELLNTLNGRSCPSPTPGRASGRWPRSSSPPCRWAVLAAPARQRCGPLTRHRPLRERSLPRWRGKR